MYNGKAFIRFVLCISMCTFLIVPILSGCEATDGGLPELKHGYYGVEYTGITDKGAAFLACGTGGRLDRIFEDSTLENIPLPVGDKDLISLLIGEGVTLVGGVSGALAYSLDGNVFKTSKGAGNEHILGLAEHKEKYYACTYSGKILSSADGVSWKTDKRLTNKPLIAIVSNDTNLMTITNDTDIFKSEDGVNWTSQNYNKIYEGLAEELSYINMVNFSNYVYTMGHSLENPDAPSVMYTIDSGETWMSTVSQRLNDLNPDEFYPLTVYSLSVFGEELLGVCNGGRVLAFTDCPSCNRISETSNADLRCIAVSDSKVLVAGDGFEFAMLAAEDLQGF